MAEKNKIYEGRLLFTYKNGEKKSDWHHVVKESPLTIMLNGEELATLLCSPDSFELLAVGFLVSEGVLLKQDELKNMSYRPEHKAVWVETTNGASRANGFLRRNFASRYEKGHFSKPALDDGKVKKPIADETTFTIKKLLGLVSLLDEKSNTFRLTGGVHEAALTNYDDFIVYYEDIGRHNALNRILGYTFLNNIDPTDKAVILSSRISSEIMIKISRIGVPVVVSRSAITGLAIDMAEQLGITVIGFARGSSLNIYTHPQRITD